MFYGAEGIKMNFCRLEKDNKTYKILSVYLEDFQSGQSLYSEDNKLQICEILEHNKLNRCDDPEEWIIKYGKKYRNYLNAIKIIAVIFYSTKFELNKDNFYQVIDSYNNCEDFFLEKIY